MKKSNYTLTTRRALKPLFLQKLPNLVFARSGENFYHCFILRKWEKMYEFLGLKSIKANNALKVLMGPMSNPMRGLSCAIINQKIKIFRIKNAFQHLTNITENYSSFPLID